MVDIKSGPQAYLGLSLVCSVSTPGIVTIIVFYTS